MHTLTRPHVSAALQHLRRSILCVGSVLGVCLIAQVIIWGVVHYTDVRHLELRQVDNARHEPVVVQRASIESPESATAVTAKAERDKLPQRESVNPNVVLSAEDELLRRSSEVTQTLGIVSALLLAVLMFQGVVIAGGASVPGVEMAVTATTWTLVIGMLCMPLASLLPGVPFAGVFRSYDALVVAADVYRQKGPGAPTGFMFFGLNLVMPLLLLAGLGAALLRFHLGVEQGAMMTSLSQVDEKLEREIRTMKLGALASPRSMSALNTAITETPIATAIQHDEPIPLPRSMKEPPMGRPLKRPV